MIDLSIIIINYKTPLLSKRAIVSINKFSDNIEYEVIVIDNNSRDESSKTLSNLKNVNFFQNKKNIGFGKACNLGMSIAQGKYFIFFNSDAYLIDNSFHRMINFMNVPSNRNVMALGGHLLNTKLKFRNSYANFHDFKLFIKGSFLTIFYNKSFYENAKVKELPYDEKSDYEVDYISGADLLIRREVYEKIGGFNEKIFMYSEDAEYCYRIKKKYKRSYS